MIKFLIVVLAVFLSACSAEIDEYSSQARPEAPIVAQVERVSVARNTNNKKTYFVVQPVRVREEGLRRVTTIKSSINTGSGAAESITGQTQLVSSTFRNYLLKRQRQITLQLTSAISGVEDFGLIDYDAFNSNPNRAKNLSADKKIYLVRAVITEISNRVVEKKSKTYVPLLYKGRKGLIQSKVALDVTVTDIDTGEVMHAFPTDGTYVSKSASTESGFIADFYKADVKVRSTIDQAIRVALNNASLELYDKIYGSNS